ncbi:MAG TPA: carboxymuconolactone decarboxylase family protein [Chthonomonadaceae bacterium]|nr:carboxymuconolactone decarboxylase family protein [Chthonomonadaceae bacterium]
MSEEQARTDAEEIAARKARGRAIMEKLTGSADATTALLTALSPDYVEWVTEFALGQVWARPGLDLKTRSLCTVAALTVLGRMDNLKTHIRGALGNGATRKEIIEVILHMTVYGGFPDAWDGLAAAREVFAAIDARSPDGTFNEQAAPETLSYEEETGAGTGE